MDMSLVVVGMTGKQSSLTFPMQCGQMLLLRTAENWGSGLTDEPRRGGSEQSTQQSRFDAPHVSIRVSESQTPYSNSVILRGLYTTQGQ